MKTHYRVFYYRTRFDNNNIVMLAGGYRVDSTMAGMWHPTSIRVMIGTFIVMVSRLAIVLREVGVECLLANFCILCTMHCTLYHCGKPLDSVTAVLPSIDS